MLRRNEEFSGRENKQCGRQNSLKNERRDRSSEEKVGKAIEKIKEQVEERIEGVAENFILISQRMEDLEKNLLTGGNENKSKSVPVSAFPETVLASPMSVTAWAKACPLAASLRGEAAEVLHTLPDTERLNLNSLCNALDLRFGQKYSRKYARLQMKTRLQIIGESLQEYAAEVEKLANLAFSDHPATVRGVISLHYFVDGLKEGEIQKVVRMADVQDLKSALLSTLKLP
ncbi:uncharacterized protein TNCV_498311 [Trichonephila clavipes]|nr:uncharacterized protein TNCV_498311 [Trichonephila clavipes]